MGQWSNLTANFLSRSCRLIILVLAISTAVPFTFGINTAQAQTVPTAVWQDLSRVPTIGEQTTLIIEFNARVLGPAGTIKGLTISDFSFTGSKTPSLGVNNRRAIIRLIPEEAQFTATLNANSVTLNGVAGPANAVTFAYTPPPTIALAGPDTGASDRDRITGQRGILITLASNFDRDRGDTWGISVDGGVDGYTRTRVDNANAAPNLRFGLGDGVYTDNQVRVRNTVNGITSDFAGLAAFTFDSTRPIINLNGGDITLTAGQTYTEQASVSDVLDTSVRLRVGGDTLDTNTAGTYDLTYDATDTAGNAAVQLTRTVTVTEPVTLSALTVSPGTLSPDFDPAISAYNVIVGAGVSSISFTPTFRAGTVVIEVAGVFGGMISSGSTSSRVFAGTRATYNIAVTHGGVSTTYSVTATRNTAPVADAGDDDTAATNAPVALDGSGSSDPNSHVGDTLSYAWEHTLTNSATPATAITLPDATAESPTFTPTAAGAYTFTLTVTDSVGASHTDTVVITVTEPPVTLSTDSTLSALEVSAGSLNPAFASGTEAYAVSVANGVTSIRITPTVTDATGATVTVGKSGATPVAVAGGEASEKIALVPGENPINIIVTAEDTSTQTYIVTVTRAANTAPEPTVTVERLPDNSIEVSWDNISGVDFTIYAIKTGEADAVIIALVTSPHTIATTDALFDTANNADAIGIRGFAEGNPVGDHSAPITSDEVPPVDITAPPVPAITTPPATVGASPITIDGTAEAGTTVELLKGGTSTGDTVTAADGTGAFSFAVTLTEGTNTFTATASDGPNTSAASSPVVITLDTETPEAPIITTQTATVGSSSFTIEGTAEAGTTVELLKAGASAGDTVTAADSGSFSFTVTLTEGANSFTATASDGANTSAASPPVVITLDTETPEVPAITTSPATVGSTPITIDGTAEAGTTVELFNGVTSAGTVTADSGSFSFTGVALNPGANSFTATASDGPNTSAASPAVVITLDTETPEAPIITTQTATVGSSSFTIDGTAEAGTTVELLKGGASVGTTTADGSGSFSFTVTLTEGTNSFTATASDGVNTSEASPAVVITLDTIAPAVPAITTLPATVGSSSFTIEGTAEAGTTVELLKGGASAGTTTADGTGNFSFAVTLTKGANSFTATASDGANTSAASPPVVITLDTETPEVPAITTSPATVGSTPITIDGTAEAGTTVELFNGVTSAGTVTADSGSFSFTGVALNPGANSFTATASDGPNTSAASPAVVITLDTETPEAPIITTQTATVGSSSFTIDGTAEAGTTVELLKGGASVGTTTADGSGSFSFTVTLTEGTNSFTATASDGVNTSEASPAVVITLDTIAPAVPAITTLPATVGSSSFTIEGTAEAGTTVELLKGGASAGTTTADGTGNFSFAVTLTKGANSFTATASDGANTSAASPPVVITLDTETPEVPAITTSPATVGSTPITIDGTAEAGTTVELFNGVTSAGTVTADSGSFSFTGVALNPGANSFTATASDGPNTSAASPAVVITLDTETPEAPIITTQTATVGSSSFTIDGTAEAGTTVELFNGVTSAGTVTADSGSFSFTGVALNPGANSFTATASDGVNTSASSSPVVITLDTTAPAIEVILSEVARVIADQNISAIAGRVERARTQQNGASSFNFAGQRMSLNGDGNNDQAMSSTVANLMNTHASSMEDGTLDMKTLLGNSEFALPLNFVGSEDGSGITFWGSGDYRNFGGEDDDQELDWDGDMFSVHFGLDGRTAEAIGGVALSWNEGEMETDDKTTYDISLTSINPYFGWGGARGEVWMTAGYGSGELKRDNGAGATSGNDLSMNTFAIGGNGIVRQRGASTLRLKGEVSQSTLEVDANKDGSGLKASEVDTNRVRVSLESTNTIALDNGARTERSAEAGIRHDGGDGTTGTGAELGFGISHVNANGFSVEGKARVLVGHGGNTNEWGVRGAIKKTAGADGQGWSFALSPGYGDDAGDIQRLWEDGLRDADGNATATDTAADATRDYAARLDLRVGYGMNGFTGPSWLGSGRGLLTPYTAMTLSNDNNRYRLGIQWKLGDRLDLDLVGEHRDADDDDDAILLKGELRF